MRGAPRGIGAVVLVAALGQACGSGGVSPPEPMSQFTGDAVAALCRRMLACCTAAEITAVDRNIVDQASCEETFAASTGSQLVGSPTLVDAGVVVYNGETARACLAALGALPCGMWGGPLVPPPIPQCNGVFVGTLPAGSTCGMSLECASDYCTNATTGAGDVCAAPAAMGESCEFAPCTSGLACMSNSSGGPRTCGQALPNGSSCHLNSDCTSGLCTADATGGQATCTPAASCKGS